MRILPRYSLVFCCSRRADWSCVSLMRPVSPSRCPSGFIPCLPKPSQPDFMSARFRKALILKGAMFMPSCPAERERLAKPEADVVARQARLSEGRPDNLVGPRRQDPDHVRRGPWLEPPHVDDEPVPPGIGRRLGEIRPPPGELPGGGVLAPARAPVGRGGGGGGIGGLGGGAITRA